MSRTALRALLSVILVSCAVPACEEEQPLPTFRLSFSARSDGDPLAGVTVIADGAALGQTDAQGALAAEVTGREGQTLAVTAQCPEGYRAAEDLPLLTLRSYRGIDPSAPARPIEMTIVCPPAERLAAVVVRTLALERAGEAPVPLADLPVMFRGRELARTDASGVAHVSFHMRPATTFRLSIDTTGHDELRPQSPGSTFTVPDANEILLFDQPFERRHKRRRVRRAEPPPAGPVLPVRLN